VSAGTNTGTSGESNRARDRMNYLPAVELDIGVYFYAHVIGNPDGVTCFAG
jgi:hypothetical protein